MLVVVGESVVIKLRYLVGLVVGVGFVIDGEIFWDLRCYEVFGEEV